MRRPLANLNAQSRNSEVLHIKLSPTSPDELLGFLPSLELVFGLDNTAQQTSLSSCRLVVSTSEIDVLMPRHNVDMRVSNRSHIDVASMSTLDPAIEAFIVASDLDIWHSNERLSTPNGLQLHVPGHVLKVNDIIEANINPKYRRYVVKSSFKGRPRSKLT